MIPLSGNNGASESGEGDGSNTVRKVVSIAGVVVGVLGLGGLLGWAGGKLLIKPPPATVPAQSNIVQTPSQAISGPSYQTQTLLGLPPVTIPGGQKQIADTLGGQDNSAAGPPSNAPAIHVAPPPADTVPAYGPSSDSGIVLIGPSGDQPPILPPAQHTPQPPVEAPPPAHVAGKAAVQAPPPAVPPVAKPAPARHAEAAAHAKPRPKPRHEAVAAKPAPKHKRIKHTATTARAADQPEAPAAGHWIVQLGVFRGAGNAQDLVTKLAHQGELASVSHRNGMFVVYVHAGSSSAARGMASRLKARGFPTYVMQGP